MAPLKNIRHERFCLFIIKGMSTNEAYAKAGYKEHTGNAVTLRAKQSISARLAELAEKLQERALVSVERLTQEYARLAYSDITDVVEFDGRKMTLKASASLSPDVTAAISEVRHTKEGIVVKFHNKVAALDALARHKGMFKENIDLKITLSLADLVNQSYEEPKLVEGKVVEDD
jgi:phage terminase small subunit